MSEELQLHNGEEIALFPLHLVLFPQMRQELHIFEDRYKEMVSWCIEHDKPFGIVLIRDGEEWGDFADPYLVGTAAKIKQVDELSEGRLNIVVVGFDRFRIRKLDPFSAPFLKGTIELLNEEDLPQSPKAIKLLKRAKESFRNYLELLFSVKDVDVRVQFPNDAATLSFAIAITLNVDLLQQQRFLELTDTVERFEEILPKLEEQVIQMRKARTFKLDVTVVSKWVSLN